jgi:hypothetical protein
MKTEKQITQLIKDSLLSDIVIDFCLAIHKENKGLFNQLIDKFETDMDILIKQNPDVYKAFRVLLDIRFIRLGLDEKAERAIIRMIGEMSKYRNEIISGDLISQIKVIKL